MVKDSFDIVPFKVALSDLMKWMKGYRVVIIGGIAASILGKPRNTQDIDVLLSLDNDKWEEFLKSAKEYNFVPRISDALKFALKSRVLLLKHAPSNIEIDLSFGALPFEEECLDRAMSVKLAGLCCPIPTPEDLIIMKAVAHRPKDMEDIRMICRGQRKLDIARIKRWTKEFADALEMPEIYYDVVQLIKKR